MASCPVEPLPGSISYTDCAKEDFDYVVIGSSFCALGFIVEMLSNCPTAKILMIEKGSYCPRVQSLSPEELGMEEKDSEEKFCWDFSTAEKEVIKRVRGINCCVGGRSCFWKAWCPKPTRDEMAGWPEAVVENVLDYFPCAKELLSVKPVNEIETNGEKLFDLLQSAMHEQLESLQKEMRDITRVEHAPLAVIEQSTRFGKYKKYSVVEPLIAKLKAHKNLRLLEKCEVKTIQTDSNPTKAVYLQTNLGDIPLGQAKLILAMSTLPSATLLLNSFPSFPGIGKRFTAHFASYIFARVPSKIYGPVTQKVRAKPNQLEMAAFYIPGKSSRSSHQFHIQLNAVAVADGKTIKLEEMRHLLKAPKCKEGMLETCCDHIVLVCASLGQTDHKNEKNRFYKKTRQSKPTLCFTTNDNDKELWDVMDTNTFQVLEQLSCDSELEYWYWNSDRKSGVWKKNRPPPEQIRHECLVHPASTMWIGDDPTSPVDIDYKLRGVDNVYLTGGALWPTGASWNPTCAMTAMAMHLGHKLQSQPHIEAVRNCLPSSQL